MEIALHSFFVSVPLAVALWIIMLLGVAGAIAALTMSRRKSGPAVDPDADPAVDPDADPAVEKAVARTVADDLRYAGEVVVAANRAAATVARRRDEWTAAEEELDAAWAAFDDADLAARRAAAATAFPLMSRRRKPGDNVDRERYLHHAATEACRNREISIAQLNDVYAHRGWNPRLHPVVQEAALRAAIRTHRQAEYERAQRRERLAWEAAESAAEALLVLRVEAAAAITRSGAAQPVTDEFWWSEQWTTAELPMAA